MLQIKRFVCNVIRENCYVVSDDTKEAVIIDCGAQFPAEQEAIRQYVKVNGLKPVHLIATHGHVDHNIGNRFVYDTWGLKVEVHKADEPLMTSLPEQAKLDEIAKYSHYQVQPVRFLEDGTLVEAERKKPQAQASRRRFRR